MRQSRFAAPRNYQPVEQQQQQAPANRPTPVPKEDRYQPSTIMHSAMPLMAATGDAFQRQFYNTNGSLPQYRTLPVNPRGTA
jgi:hypothetical protein